MATRSNLLTSLARQPRWRYAALAVVIIAAVVWFRAGPKTSASGVTFTARRGPLDITVLEGGGVQALESQEIKCEARVGYQGVKILKIVEEGYLVTEDDIRTNRVLVELDSSELQKQLVQQEIQYESATASLTDAHQGYEIQLNQNLSDIKAAQQKAKFARMDFDKYIGDKAAQQIIDQLGIEKELEAEQTNVVSRLESALPASEPGPASPNPAPNPPAGTNVVLAAGAGSPVPAPVPAPPLTAGTVQAPAPPPTTATEPELPRPTPPKPLPAIDFSRFSDINALGDGEAKQKWRELEDTLQVAKKELGQAQSQLAGTQRLSEKGFVTKIDLERDEIAAQNAELKVKKGETARDLFTKYEFPKTTEEWMSKYVEAARELNRARKAAVSKLAQAEAKWRSAEAQFDVQKRQLKDLKDQVAKCTITAKKPGLVVYGGGGDEMFFYGDQERIREGGTVRERQSIITIPDMTKMGVKVKIHESYIKQVKKGQKVRIIADAFPDKVLNGEVAKVGVLPDSQNRWMNPDLKVYLTTIEIDGTHDWLKPGMTAKVEILVDRLADVVYVPVQAVSPKDGKQFCHVVHTGGTAPQEVEIGQFNDEFIEIKKGLQEGDRILLRPPELAPQEATPKPAGGEKPKIPATAQAAAPAKS